MRPEDRVVVGEGAVSIDDAVKQVAHGGAGAVVVMLGTVRDHTNKDGARVNVTRLEYESYAAMAEKVIAQILDETEQEYPGLRSTVRHRTGALAIGDVAVVVAVSSAHRKDAFAACARIIDRLKEDAPIWKREHGDDGVSWVGLRP